MLTDHRGYKITQSQERWIWIMEFLRLRKSKVLVCGGQQQSLLAQTRMLCPSHGDRAKRVQWLWKLEYHEPWLPLFSEFAILVREQVQGQDEFGKASPCIYIAQQEQKHFIKGIDVSAPFPRSIHVFSTILLFCSWNTVTRFSAAIVKLVINASWRLYYLHLK